MKLINKLITKTAIYKHLNKLYEQALKDVEVMQDKCKKYYNEKKVAQELLAQSGSDNLKLQKDLESQEISLNEWYQIADVRTKERDKLKTVLRKILTHIRKLDKKDENVKAIKQLIKEVL